MRSISLAFIIVLFLARLSYAQKNAIDSLKQVLKTAKEDTAKVNTLNALSASYGGEGDYTNAISYANDALSVSNKISFKKGLVNACNRLGIIYREQGNYAEGLKHLFAGLKTAEEIAFKSGIVDCYNNIGTIYLYQNKGAEAIKYHYAALKIAEEINNKQKIAFTYMCLGSDFIGLNDYSESEKKYLTGLKLAKEIGDKSTVTVCYVNLGSLYLNMQNYSEAEKYLTGGLQLASDNGYKGVMVGTYSNLGVLNIRLKRLQKAEDYLAKGLLLAKEIGNKVKIKNIYFNLSRVDSIKGDFIGAYNHFVQYSDMKDIIFNEQSEKDISQLKIQYETEKKENELATLKIANELQIQKTRIFILIAILSFLIICVFWFKSRAGRRKLIISEKELEKKKLELKNRDLLFEKEKAEERSKVQEEIAKEYHDNIGAKITSLIFMCENEKAEAKEDEMRVKEISSRVALKLKDIAEMNRSGILALDPDAQELDSFIAKLWSDLTDQAETAGVEIEFSIPSDLPKIKIQPEVKFNLSSIMKEAISNSIKYSKTNEMTVVIEVMDSRYIISVIDHGTGIDPTQLKLHSYGLKNMKGRMESIGGTCEIISELGAGTTIRLKGDFSFTAKNKVKVLY